MRLKLILRNMKWGASLFLGAQCVIASQALSSITPEILHRLSGVNQGLISVATKFNS
jgi:hypothetical protein